MPSRRPLPSAASPRRWLNPAAASGSRTGRTARCSGSLPGTAWSPGSASAASSARSPPRAAASGPPSTRPGRVTAAARSTPSTRRGRHTIDPAAGTSNDMPPPQFLGLTNDGLVTLNHVAGPDGTRLVPDLALALPAPADNGRTYTFHLRPGIRYSTGALVRPSDVTRSFERLFKLGSAGAPYYQAIGGAAACQKAPATCDLSRGIAADDRAGTVTFHLTQPDPDFLYKLALTSRRRAARNDPRPGGPDTAAGHRPVHDQPLHPGAGTAHGPQPAVPRMVGRGPASRPPGPDPDPPRPQRGAHMPRPRSPTARATSCPASARSRPAPPTSSTTAASSGSTRS